MREKLARLKYGVVEFWEHTVAPLIGDYVIMPVIDALGWVLDHPIPFTLTIIAGVLLGLVIGA